MKRVNILTRLKKCGVIAVVRGKSCEEAIKSCDALVEGGIVGLEVTFTIPQAEKAIEALLDKYKNNSRVVIGAGTILDPATARLALNSGAQYIVSPFFDQGTSELCNLYQIPYIPGCMTVTEIKTALSSGVDIVKLFPGNSFDPNIIFAIKAPLPHINVMVTGGVNLENMGSWFETGATLVGIGGNILAPAELNNYDEITDKAKKYMSKFKSFKNVVE